MNEMGGGGQCRYIILGVGGRRGCSELLWFGLFWNDFILFSILDILLIYYFIYFFYHHLIVSSSHQGKRNQKQTNTPNNITLKIIYTWKKITTPKTTNLESKKERKNTCNINKNKAPMNYNHPSLLMPYGMCVYWL